MKERLDQKELFEEIVRCKDNIQFIASYVQNDLNYLLEDGIINESQINILIEEAGEDFDKAIKTLLELKSKVRTCLEYYLK